MPIDTASRMAKMAYSPNSVTIVRPDYGTKELHDRHTVIMEGDSRTDKDGSASHHARVIDQRVIDRLWRNERIDGRQRKAARRLLASFLRAGMSAKITIDFQRAAVSSRQEISDIAIAARYETNAALRAISPLNDIIWDVVLADKTLTQIEIERQWRPGTAFVVLDLGLQSLARHYGFEETT